MAVAATLHLIHRNDVVAKRVIASCEVEICRKGSRNDRRASTSRSRLEESVVRYKLVQNFSRVRSSPVHSTNPVNSRIRALLKERARIAKAW